MQQSKDESEPVKPSTGRFQVTHSDSVPDVRSVFHPSITPITVTPGVDTFGTSDYFEPHAQTTLSSPFGDDQRVPDSPSAVAAGARSGTELLPHMSLVSRSGIGSNPADVDPRTAHPTLGLSGGIISATFCIPYSAGLRGGAEWARLPKPTNSAAVQANMDRRN
jgi:trehalose 6-phosphate synthase/phosphatase